MNSPGLIELFVIVFLFWVLLGPNKVMEGARLLGKAYREFRGYGTGIGHRTGYGTKRKPRKTKKKSNRRKTKKTK